MAGTPEQPVLEYASRERGVRGRWRLLLIIVALAAATGIGWRWGPPYWKQAKSVWAERRVTRFRPAADTVVFTNDAPEAERLLAGSGYVRVPNTRDRLGPGSHVYAGYSPPELYLFGLTSPGGGRFPPAFVKYRRAPGAAERVVHVELSLDLEVLPRKLAEPHIRGLELDKNPSERLIVFQAIRLEARVFSPSTYRPGSTLSAVAPRGPRSVLLLVPNRVKQGASYPGGTWWWPAATRVRWGSAVAGDESRWTIPYDIEGEPGVISGRLLTDDSVEWKVESGGLIFRAVE